MTITEYLLCVVIIFLSVVFGYTVGVIHTQNDAVKEGHAYYEDGEFYWKTPYRYVRDKLLETEAPIWGTKDEN